MSATRKAALTAVACEVALLLIITAVAAFLRLHQLATVPPGFYHDESIYAVLSEYVFHGNRSLYFGEREGLFMYLLAFVMSKWGHDILTLRTTVALLGTATVPATYLLARLLASRQVALLAAAGLAVSFWHVALSRLVFRAMTLPLFEVVTLVLFWTALRCNRRPAKVTFFTLAGATLGLTLYTYIAARMLPLLLIVFGLSLVTLNRGRSWFSPPGLTAMALAFVVVTLPLAQFVWQNPESFLGRMGEVSLGGSGASSADLLFANLTKVAGMFFLAGDANWRHNLSGLPVLTPLGGIAFVLGLVYSIRRWRQPEPRFVLLWLVLTLAPTLLAVDAPHYLRAAGALPAIYLLAAYGANWVVAAFDSALPGRWRQPAGVIGAALVVAILLIGGGLTHHRYFNRWAPSPEVYIAFDGPHYTLADELVSTPAWRDAPVEQRRSFVSNHFWTDRTAMMFRLWPWISGRDRDDMGDTRLGLRWLEEDNQLLLPPEGGSYYLHSGGSWTAQQLLAVYGNNLEVAEVRAPLSAQQAYWRFVVGSQSAAKAEPVTGPLQLLHLELGEELPAGHRKEAVSHWVLGEAPAAWKASHSRPELSMLLQPAQGEAVEIALSHLPHAADWRNGDTLFLLHQLDVPASVPPGSYQLQLILRPSSPANEETVLGSLPQMVTR